MAFTPETGSGSTTANSYASVATADAFWADRGGDEADTWLGAVTADKERALVRATDYLRHAKRYRWVGTKKTYAQRLAWPRSNAIERNGQAIPDTVVPTEVVEATCYLAYRALQTGTLADLQPDLPRGGRITSETVGPISTSYAPDAPPETVVQFVDGLLAALLRDPTDWTPTVEFTAAETPRAFEEGEFSDTWPQAGER